jgi:hypothetical protein
LTQELVAGHVIEATSTMPRRSWRRFGPGEEPDEVRAGDLVFRAGNRHEMSVAISCGQFLRAETRPFARWNHVMLVLDETGRTAHSTGTGLHDGRLGDLRDATYALVQFECSNEDRAQIVTFAEHLLRCHPQWGWLIAGSQLFSLLTGSRVVFGKLGTITCSGFAAEALVRAGAIFDRPAVLMSPADLARACGLPGAIRASDVPPAVRRVSVAARRLAAGSTASGPPGTRGPC